MNEEQLQRLTGTRQHWFRFWMPYSFQKMEHAKVKHLYLPLNRNYKPLGMTTGEWVDYDPYVQSHGVVFGSDPHKFAGVWYGEHEKSLYMYADVPSSRRDYFQRLEMLMSHVMKLAEFEFDAASTNFS